MTITLPDPSLVVLVGPSGSGKSTFARRHFRPTEVLSSDQCRGLVADDEADQSATPDAFAVLHFILERRLAANRLTVVDATHVQPDSRRPLLDLARRYHARAVAVAFDLPEDACLAHNAGRGDRAIPPRVVRGHARQMRPALAAMHKERFHRIHVLRSAAQAAAAEVERVPLPEDRRADRGPFDLIGDVHGCYAELCELLERLGYAVGPDEDGVPRVTPPPGRRAVFLGDLCDRGPASPAVLRLVMGMAARGDALCVPGNHDHKLVRFLRGEPVKMSHGLSLTAEQLAAEPPDLGPRVAAFLDALPTHLVLDGGRLVAAHAGLPEAMHGRHSGAVRSFALYGDTTGETDADGLPVRRDWARDYRGRAAVVYGHTPAAVPRWVNNTACVDTGCVFGGRLTALRWPEREFVAVPARARYAESKRPFDAAVADDPLPDLARVSGRMAVETGLLGTVVVREGNAAAALEAMSRFAADPRWLVYLPPTMSPCDTAPAGNALERPAEAFAFYAAAGVDAVVCQAKHMGSRAVVVVCRDAAAAAARFGVDTGEAGVVLTRTGRRFFADAATEAAVLDRVRSAMTAAGLWDEFATSWAVLDAELLPWSAKAGELLRTQYAAVGSAATATLTAAAGLFDGRPDVAELAGRTRRRLDDAGRFVAAYRRYCWPVRSVADLRLAPFHLLATEGRVHADRDHLWHLDCVGRLAAADPAFAIATPHVVLDPADAAQVAAAAAWWEALTAAGGEGMVVKPLAFAPRGAAGRPVQPAVKVRGREYLRIVYGPDYTAPEHLSRLRRRALGHKRALAAAEFALGLEGLERFVRRETFARVHECAFAVLALESEPVDPRL